MRRSSHAMVDLVSEASHDGASIFCRIRITAP